MDRAFLEYYEEELAHIRVLATEFAAMHPAVARNLSLDTVPCPDPYVERLLEGVAYLCARTRLKLDAEGSRFARTVLDALYPDLVAPAPAVGMVALQPGQQVQTMSPAMWYRAAPAWLPGCARAFRRAPSTARPRT